MINKFIKFFTSMKFSVLILILIGFLSSIGTILIQNENKDFYINKFGYFWSNIFFTFQLNNIYNSLLFIVLIIILIINIFLCLTNNFNKYKKINLRKIGYILTHSSIFIICLLSLINSDLRLRYYLWKNDKNSIKIEEAITDKNILDIDNFQFSSYLQLKDNESSSFSNIYLDNNNLLIQKLPFSIKLEKFRIEYYKNGNPKSFISDINIDNKKTSILVNKPFTYKGITIYQSGFINNVDLDLELNNLNNKNKIQINASIGDIFEIENLNLEIIDINKEFLIYKLAKNENIIEYKHYLNNIELNGQMFLLLGFRLNLKTDYKYLFIPIFKDINIDYILSLNKSLEDKNILNQAIKNYAKNNEYLEKSSYYFINIFKNNGLDGIDNFIINKVPANEQHNTKIIIMNIIKNIFYYIIKINYPKEYLSHILKDNNLEKIIINNSEIKKHDIFYLFTIKNIKEINYSVLQIIKSPIKNIIFLAVFSLIIGVFILFISKNKYL